MVERDREAALAEANRKANRAAENGWTLVEVQRGVWLGTDLQGWSVAVVAGSKPMSDVVKEARSKARKRREKFHVEPDSSTHWKA